MIPLGILATTSGGAAAGAYELISTTYGTGSSGTITFSSIPSTYKHLQIRAAIRSTRANQFSQIQMRLNSDTGSNYSVHRLYGDGTSITSQGYASQSLFIGSFFAAADQASGIHGSEIIDILDYSSTLKNKTIRGSGGFNPSTGTPDIRMYSGAWLSTTAISSIQLIDGYGANFTTTSRFSLYGIK